MSGAVTAAAIGAVGAGYGAYQNRQAAKDAAAGGQVQPYGQTGEMMDALLNDAWQQFKWGNFQFGPDPGVYNQYLDWGGNALGLNTSGIERLDPFAQGYGPEAYSWMLDLIQGPAWAGRTQTQPVAPTQDPWVAGLLGGLGGYASAGGFDPQQAGISTNPSSLQISAVDRSYVPNYYDWTQTPTYVPSWEQQINVGGGS